MKKKGLAASLFGDKKNRTISFLVVIIAYIVLQLLQGTHSLSSHMAGLLVPVCCYIVAAIGLNLNVGISGELNLGQAGFMSIGGFTAVVVSTVMFEHTENHALILIVSILAGAAMAGFLGWLISIPVLKLEGDYLAIVTLAFGQIIMSLIGNLYIGYDHAGLHFAFINNTLKLADDGYMIIEGPMGATGVERLSTFTAGFILILIALLLAYNLIYSKTGRAIVACRDNRIAAETVGINVAHTKTVAFVLSSVLGGAAGALFLLNYSSTVASQFDFNASIMILVYVVLGGLGNITGTIIGTTVLYILPEVLRFLADYRMLIYAVILIVIMLVSNNEKVKTWMEKIKARSSHEKGGTVNE